PRAGRASRSRICGPPSAAEVLLRRLLGLGGRGGLLALGARRPAVFRGRRADLVQEKAREVALRGEAKLGRDLADLAAARGKPRDRRLDAQHVEVDARREAGAELEEIVEARAREADLARELVHVELLVRPRAQERDRPPDARVLEARAAPQARLRAAPGEIGLDDGKEQLLQHELQALGRQGPVILHFHRQRVCELADARGDGLRRLHERVALVGLEHGREAGAQPLAPCVQREHARRAGAYMTFAGVEEQHAVIAALQHDDGIGLRLQPVAGSELGQHQPAETALAKSQRAPHGRTEYSYSALVREPARALGRDYVRIYTDPAKSAEEPPVLDLDAAVHHRAEPGSVRLGRRRLAFDPELLP